jgi:GDP-L-fucose synthase
MTLTVWGSGAPRREFLHVDDLAAATLFVLENDVQTGVFNVGVGEDLSIRELAQTVCDVVGFEGELQFDASKPDGTPRKLLDVSRLAEMGWRASIGLADGIANTYREFAEKYEEKFGAPALAMAARA